MTDNQLKIALLPLDIAWGDIDENLLTTVHALNHVDRDTDLVVLPEMFTTGFITEPTLLVTIDRDRTEHTVAELLRWSQHFGFAIAGSFVARDHGRIYNRGFVAEPSGDITYYDKHHLFSLGGEARTFSAGEKRPPIVRFRGCNIMLLVCYDLRFPTWARNVDCGYDLLIYPANWPDSRAQAWQTLLPARAIENQAYVIGCNRTGTDDFGTYSPGRSYLFNDWGDNISQPSLEGIVYGTVDLAALERNRRKFPVWRDADPYPLVP